MTLVQALAGAELATTMLRPGSVSGKASSPCSVTRQGIGDHRVTQLGADVPVAAGDLDEAAFADWLRRYLQAR